MCQKGLSGSGRADQQNIGLLKLDIGFFPGELDTFVMIVNGDCQFLFGFVLPNDVLIEKCFDVGWFGKMYVSAGRFVILVFIDDVLAYAYTFIAYENGWTCNQLSNFILAFVAEGTTQDVVTVLLHVRFEMTSSIIP